MTSRLPPLLLLAALLAGCPTEDGEEAVDTGIECVPADVVDFGTITECTEHYGDLTVINHGPDSEEISVNVDALFYQGFAVTNFLPDVTLDPGDEYSMAIGVSPGPGGAGTREAYIDIVTDERWIQILVRAEVVAGDECDDL